MNAKPTYVKVLPFGDYFVLRQLMGREFYKREANSISWQREDATATKFPNIQAVLNEAEKQNLHIPWSGDYVTINHYLDRYVLVNDLRQYFQSFDRDTFTSCFGFKVDRRTKLYPSKSIARLWAYEFFMRVRDE
jgi:hypothetical protein